MALTYNNAVRDLTIECEIVLASADPNDVERIQLTAADVISYSGNGTIGSEGLPLGSAEAASYTLVIDNIRRDSNGEAVGKKYVPEIFDNAEVRARIGIEINGTISYSDFGVWYVNDSFAPEQGVTITLNGYDALATRFEAVFEDDKNDYGGGKMNLARMVQRACTAAGIAFSGNAFPNSTLAIDKMPSWEDGTTLRQVLSYCAILAGGFVRMSRKGQVEIVSYAEGETYALGADLYQQFSATGGSKFAFNAIEAMLKVDSDEYSRFTKHENISDNATNTIQIDYNPLLNKDRLSLTLDVLDGAALVFEAGSVVWGGDPIVVCGDRYEITDLEGKKHVLLITQQSFQFDGGLSFTDTCVLPSINTVSSPTFSTSTNMYDANGNLRVTHISGFGQSVINATAGHIGQLTSDNIETDMLSANLISALNLMVGLINATSLKANSVTANQIAAETITSAQIAAGAITADKIKAGAIDADAIKAITAEINRIVAGKITTAELYSAMANITVLAAGTATFDKATVEHLVANLFNLTGQAVMEDVFIHNLKIAYAQMVSASIGNLVLQSSDGKYYQIDVSQSGQVTASQVYPSAAEEENGVFGETRPIIATQMTVDEMNASTIKAVSMLVNKIDAAKIDTDELFAREAFITKLTTSKIVGDKSLILISKSADDAKTAAEQAKTTADTANANAASAQTAASDAASDASAAKTAATNAQGSASTASAAASNAATSASDAKKAADNASAVANEAKSDAKTATDIANAAKATADTASSNAEDALRDATNAGTLAQKAVDDLGDIPNYVEIPEDGSGVYVKDIQGESVLKLNSGSVSIGAVSGAAKGYSQLTANYVQFGNYQLRKSGDGGLVFKLAEG